MRAIFHAFVIALTLSLPAAGAHAAGAADDLNRGPRAGMQIPHDLSLPDQNGQRMNYMARARAKGLIVLFSRSVGW